MEYDTWVPMVKNNVPRSVLLLLVCSGLLLGCTFAPEQAGSAAFYLTLIVAGNALLWWMERWTAARDRAAIQAGVPTGGWGIDPSRSLLDRFRVDGEVRKTTHKS